jgi:hypothetical protein
MGAIARGRTALSRRVHDDLCDTCSEAELNIEIGTIRRCKYCGKAISRQTTMRRMKRKDVPDTTVHIVSVVCSARYCQRSDEMAKYCPQWSPSDRDLIARGQIRLGFTKEQVGYAKGAPSRVNRTVTAQSTTEQWVYGNKTYLYFTDNVLTGWQD